MAYTIKSGDTLSAIAQANKTDITTLQKLNPTITDPNKIFAGQSLNLPTATLSPAVQDLTAKTNQLLGGEIFNTQTGIANPIEAPKAPVVQPPTPPVPESPQVQNDFNTSLQAQLEAQRKAYEDSLKKQEEANRVAREESQKKIDDLSKLQQEGVLTKAEELAKPFREELEKTQRESLYINQNFEANQKLTNELDTLLTEGNQLIEQARGKAIPEVFRSRNVNKAMNDVNARAGVIQAVLSARNGQISQAYNMIDRTVTAITSDRKDQLNYYQSLYDFYQNQKDDEGKKLAIFTSDEKKYIDSQINLLGKDLEDIQNNANKIKEAMTDPDTAQAYADAGVTLNDSPEQIAKKLADYSYSKEVSDQANDMAKSGYTFLPEGSSAPAGTEVQTTIDSRGKKKTYYKIKTASPEDTKKTDYTNAENFLADNPNASYEELRNEIMKRTKLSSTEIDSILSAKGKRPSKIETAEVYLSPENTNAVANALIDGYGSKQEAINAIQATKSADINGKTINLTNTQVQSIIDSINASQEPSNMNWIDNVYKTVKSWF